MKNIVVKDNALINASYNLDLAEQRLILLAIVEARESGKGINTNDPLVVHAESYAHQFNVHKNTAYTTLKNACNALFLRQFSYQEESSSNIEYIKSRWVSEIRYIENEAVVKLIFAPAIVPLITRLEEHFTKYELEQISNLSSAYAIRLYELLIQWRSVGKTPLFQIEDFRFKLGLGSDEYQIMGNFKKKVLDLALTQINEKTDIVASCEQHKVGRNITGFSFSFTSKHPEADKQATPRKLSEKQIRLFANKLAHYDPFASQIAAVGESYENLEERLLTDLQDVQNVRKYASFLKELGLDV